MVFKYAILITIVLSYLMDNTIAASLAPTKDIDCPKDCKLIIENQQHTYRQFRVKASVEAIRIIKLKMSAFNSSKNLQKILDRYLFVWSRAVAGEPIFSLPLDYIAACLYLPLTFYDSIWVNLAESEEGCLIKLNKSDYCVRKIIFESLINLTRVDNCNSLTCDTICNRNDSTFYDPNKRGYTCCDDEDLSSNSTSIRSCLKEKPKLIFYQLDIVIAIASFLALISTYIYIARTFVCWKGR